MSKNSMMLDILYDSELCHEDAGYSKAEKAKYNREYYQKHKQYWKDYYKTGQGIGRDPRQTLAEKRLSKFQEANKVLDSKTKDKYEAARKAALKSIANGTKKTASAYKKATTLDIDKINRDSDLQNRAKQIEEANKFLDSKTHWDDSKPAKAVKKAALKSIANGTKKTASAYKKATTLDIDKINRDSDLQNRAKQIEEANKFLDSKTHWDDSKPAKAVKKAAKEYTKKAIERNINNLKEDIKDPGDLKKSVKRFEEANKFLDAHSQDKYEAVSKKVSKSAVEQAKKTLSTYKKVSTIDPSKHKSIKEGNGESHSSSYNDVTKLHSDMVNAQRQLVKLKNDGASKKDIDAANRRYTELLKLYRSLAPATTDDPTGMKKVYEYSKKGSFNKSGGSGRW